MKTTHKKAVKTATAIACAVAVGPGLAQNAALNDEVVVTAKGVQTIGNIINTAHVFTEQDIVAAQVKSIPALLERVAGISVNDSGGRGSVTTVFIRGVSASQTIVLIDGVRVGSATLGAAALNSYPVEAIERIEVLKGPFSGIYGADAVGGVIQLFTKKGANNEKSVSASIGSQSLSEASIALGFGNEKSSLHIGVQREDTDGIDRTSITSGGNDDEDKYEETAFSLGGKLNLSDNTVAKLTVLATDNTVEFDNLFGNGVGNQTENKTLSTAFNLSHNVNDRLTLSTTFGVNEDEAVTTSAFPSVFETNRNTLGAELQFAASDITYLTAGIDYYEEDIESTTAYPTKERDNKALYAQLQTGFAGFDLVTSLRSDDNSAYGSDTNGSIAVAYSLTDTLRLSASYGTAFVAPSFNFLYFPFFGNPGILPEESDNVEINLSGDYGITSWRISAYQTDVENLFSFNPSTFLAANVGKAEFQGIEAEINTSMFEWQISVQADLLDAENALTGEQLDDRAQRSLSINAQRRWGPVDLNLDLRAETGRVDRGGTEVSGYGLFDISAAYQVNDNLVLLANVDNVFDKDYTVNLATATERFNTEGRQVKLTLQYSF